MVLYLYLVLSKQPVLPLPTHSDFCRNEGSQQPILISALSRKETRYLPAPPAFVSAESQLSGPLESCNLKREPVFTGLSPLRRVSSPGLSTLKHLGLRCSQFIFSVLSPLSKHLSSAEFFFLTVISIQGFHLPQTSRTLTSRVYQGQHSCFSKPWAGQMASR